MSSLIGILIAIHLHLLWANLTSFSALALPCLSNQGSGNVLTRSKPFRKLATWAFSVCDSDKTGEVGKLELYCGLLLVHLNLAKYAGPAACYVSWQQYIIVELYFFLYLSWLMLTTHSSETLTFCGFLLHFKIMITYRILYYIILYYI